jgi:preprotein translocase subunit SecA
MVAPRALGVREGWRVRLDRARGSTVELDLGRLGPELAAITALDGAMRRLSDGELLGRSRVLAEQAREGTPRTALRVPGYALVREAARRTLREHPFEEQVVAALALDDARIVEMQTGEGKTLAATMPAALNALGGLGVHVLTFNDYLARRDASWMAPVYRAIGFTTACVAEGLAPAARRAAYAADITYVTAKEAGFDHLRDGLALDPDAIVHRPFHFAIVDEADSLLVDEARVPLVIAGDAERESSQATRVDAVVRQLRAGVHFDTDEYRRNVELTEAGIEAVQQALGCNLHDAGSVAMLTEVNCALHAHVLLRRDVDYIVRGGRVEIVDEFTGRGVADRHWPDGLQAALDAKEQVARRADGRILGSMTLQRFLRRYPRLCGMTGTARDAAQELWATYGLEVSVVPPHRPIVRIDREDVVFTHRAAKERAVIEAVRTAHACGRPVLVGTASVTESEELAESLRVEGIACEVLNARRDDEEAAIVRRAGMPGAVTISTNMAGRGTDIRLGGPGGEARARVEALGGLLVIGTNRHESRRVDLQLRGRAGRQGDPGESRFYVSLEDDLLARYGIARLIPARICAERADGPIDHPVVRREIARAQRISEGQNFDIRRTLARYAAVVERQGEILAERRGLVLREGSPGAFGVDPARRDEFVRLAGEPAVTEAERRIVLGAIDRAWCEHLAYCADVREGIHLEHIGGRDPLTEFTRQAIAAFSRVDELVDAAVRDALRAVRVIDGRIDLEGTGLTAPVSTWTYLVNDDPFRNRLVAMLSGPGGATLAIYSALMAMPLFMVWGIVDRLFGSRGSVTRNEAPGPDPAARRGWRGRRRK